MQRLTETIKINAEPARVWQALTDRQIAKEWSNADFKTDWSVGDVFEIVSQIGTKDYHQKAVVMRADAPRALEYSYWSPMSGLPDIPESYARVKMSLEWQHGYTVLTVEHAVPATPVRRGKGWEVGPESGWKHARFYWRMTLPILQKVVEGTL